jgi:serine/threonine protein kinase
MDKSDKKSVPKNVISDIESELTIMHELGFAHLDLHEDNVLVRLDSKKRKIRKTTICDFGLAKSLKEISQKDIAEVIDDYDLKQTKDPRKLDFLMVREIEKQWK